MSDEQQVLDAATTESTAATDASTDQDHPVSKPPFPFSEGQEVSLGDGKTGKIVSITNDESGTVTYSVTTAEIRSCSEAELRKV